MKNETCTGIITKVLFKQELFYAGQGVELKGIYINIKYLKLLSLSVFCSQRLGQENLQFHYLGTSQPQRSNMFYSQSTSVFTYCEKPAGFLLITETQQRKEFLFFYCCFKTHHSLSVREN